MSGTPLKNHVNNLNLWRDNCYNGRQTLNVWRQKMSRSRESRRCGSRKERTKITFAARARTLNRFQITIMKTRDSPS